MRNIYIWRLFCKKFDNFELFITTVKNIPIFEELKEKIKKEIDNAKYIFKESFITQKSLRNYKKLSEQIDDIYINNKKDIKLDYNEINKNFDYIIQF